DRKLGLYLHPSSPKDRRSWPNLALNLSFILIFAYCNYASLSHYYYGWYTRQNKPLYNITASGFVTVLPIVFLIAMLYFLVTGSRIVRLLDSSCFHVSADSIASSSVLRSKLTVFFIVLLDL